MRSLIAALLTFSLATPALAEEAACVRGFRLKNADFYAKTDNLKNLETLSYVVQWGLGPATGAACAILARKAWWGVMGCAFLGGAIWYGGSVGVNMNAAAIVREEAVQSSSEESFLIYQIYRAYRSGETATSADVAILLRALGVNLLDKQDDSEMAAKAAAIVGDLMESGELCNRANEPAVDYWSMLPMVKERL